MGEFLSSEGDREDRTNSGDFMFERWVRKSGRHGAGPTAEGVVADVDIVRAIRKRRELALEAILDSSSSSNSKGMHWTCDKGNCDLFLRSCLL